jgi:hypothetical protein
MANKKRNALKHGASAKKVMLWSERYKDFEALRDGLCQEYSPSGSTEEYLVETLLDLLWHKRRLECREQIAIQQRLDEVRADNEHTRADRRCSRRDGRTKIPSPRHISF